GICHCRMCQKAVGGPFLAWAMVPSADFAWTRGQPAMFRSSSAATRGFCARCGTPLYFQYDRKSDHFDVTIGSLDQPDRVTPRVALGVESRLHWCDPEKFTELRGHDTGSLGSPEDLTRITNFQHPDHDTPSGWQAPAG
ncbi:MAG TPA: GFA family protein, partial [Acetobacteraceae bacterium]